MDPEKDPSKDAGGGRNKDRPGVDGASSGDATSGDSLSGGPTKPPPWQVPKPELRPELLTPDQGPLTQDPGTKGSSTKGPRTKGSGSTPPPFPQPSPVFDPFARDRDRDAAARKKRSQRRTVVVGLGVTALLAGTITAIVASNEQDPDYAQVCFNEETGERVEDTQCNSSAGRGGALYAWYFYARGASVPGIGQNRTAYPNFTRTVPQGAKTSTGYSSKGGTVSRGGFGSSSKGGSTGG